MPPFWMGTSSSPAGPGRRKRRDCGLVGMRPSVKTFYKENGHFRLQPENDTMDPIIVGGGRHFRQR